MKVCRIICRLNDRIINARTLNIDPVSYTHLIPGDLSLALPKRQLDDIIEMIYALDKVAPGTANYDTLLYGAEVKFYYSRLELSHELETKLPGFFAIGDGAGTTRGLAQAGASGIKAARAVLSRIK